MLKVNEIWFGMRLWIRRTKEMMVAVATVEVVSEKVLVIVSDAIVTETVKNIVEGET